MDTSKTLAEKIPNDFVKVSESGISNVEAIKELRTFGYKGFLIGENFMKTDDPGKSAAEFIKELAPLAPEGGINALENAEKRFK